MTKKQVQQTKDWIDDDWEAKDLPREARSLISRLLLTLEKGFADDPANRRK